MTEPNSRRFRTQRKEQGRKGTTLKSDFGSAIQNNIGPGFARRWMTWLHAKMTATRNMLNPDEIHFDLLGVLGSSVASLFSAVGVRFYG
jgi:hypothetical protein